MGILFRKKRVCGSKGFLGCSQRIYALKDNQAKSPEIGLTKVEKSDKRIGQKHFLESQKLWQNSGGDMMDDLISRQAAIDAIGEIHPLDYNAQAIAEKIKGLPSAQPEVIRCKDCRWWDKYSETQGYCMAAKHGYYSSHWEIHIRRTYGEDFFCADAEPIEEEGEEHGLDR